MSIKPVDFQVMIPKASELSRIQETDHQKDNVLQQNQANSMQHKVDNSLKQVYSQNKAQEARITEKQEKQRENNKEGKKKGSNSKNKQAGIKTSTIDIKI